VRVHHEPALVPHPTAVRLTDDLVRHAAAAPDSVLVARRVRDGSWDRATASDLLADVAAVARGLIALGVEPGDRVALMSRTRYEWTVLDQAIWFAAGITVPVYETSSAEQLGWILRDSGARVAVVETEAHAALLASVAPELATRERLHVLERDGLDGLRRLGADVAAERVQERRLVVGPDDVATVIYTSGTTGRPKGCTLTHGAFIAQAENVVACAPELFAAPDACTLLFLPLAHVFGRIVAIASLHAGIPVGYAPDVRTLPEDLASFRPTFLLAVPRVFEKVYNAAQQRAIESGRGAVFARAVRVAVAWSTAQDAGRIGPGLRLQHAVFDRLVYSRLRAALGGRVAYAVSGGAPLGLRLTHFFRGVGVTVLEGYGLTETGGSTTVNRPAALRMGTVGRPFPGASARISDDGEVQLGGTHLFRGYWSDAEATAAAFTPDGWLRTGDLGALDDDGYLSITGRTKEILVTAGGKNIAPTVLEDRVRAHWLVGQCMVVGEARPYVAALVTIDPETFGSWKSRAGKATDATVADLVDDADLRAEVQAAIDDANLAVSTAESIRRFHVLAEDWTEEGGELTPSMKLRRSVVMERHGAAVDALYD
jgi:long-chain acyl-CoA synthetase